MLVKITIDQQRYLCWAQDSRAVKHGQFQLLFQHLKAFDGTRLNRFPIVIFDVNNDGHSFQGIIILFRLSAL